MIGRLMVPVAGTIAALIVITLAHEPRGPAPEPHQPRAPEHDDTLLDEPEPPETAPPEEGHSYRLELRADGTLVDLDDKGTFASAADFLERVPGGGHEVELSKGKGTADAALDEVQAKLEESRPGGEPRFHVSRKLPPPPQTFQIQLLADGTFLDPERGATFASVQELVDELGDGRHTLLVSNASGVAEADLDATVAKLREANPALQLRKVYRAPEAPAGD